MEAKMTATITLTPAAAAHLVAIKTGEAQTATWVSDVKPAAAHKTHTLTKVVTATIETGDYAKRPENAGVTTGERKWGEWAVFPYIAEHKGTFYARLYVKEFVSVVYLKDGAPVGAAEFKAMLTPSAANRPAPNAGCIDVKVASLRLA